MLTPKFILILFTGGHPNVQCTKNRLTGENYIDNYEIIQEHQLNSRKFPVFPGVPVYVDTLSSSAPQAKLGCRTAKQKCNVAAQISSEIEIS